MHKRTHRHAHWLIPIMFGLCSASGHANAQDDRGIELASQPTVVHALDLALHLPVDSVAQTTIAPGGRTRTVVQPDNGAWIIQVFNSKSSDLDLTATRALDEIVRQRQAESVVTFTDSTGRQLRAPSVRPFDVVVFDIRNQTSVEFAQAARAYLESDPDVPRSETVPVTGYTVLRTEPGSFLVFQIDCPAASFGEARIVYETVVAAARRMRPGQSEPERAASMSAGKRLLASIGAEDLEACLSAEPVFYRLFAPAADGAGGGRELGYQRVEIRSGQLGELDPRKPRTAWTLSEREVGFLVRIDARTLHDGAVIDSQAIFFLSRERERETWSIVMEQKSGEQLARSTQTLVRRGTRLTVNTSEPGGAPRTSEFDVLEGHFLSGVERYLMPQLVARLAPPEGPIELDHSYYTFDPARGSVSQRRDIWTRLDAGGWSCQTQPGAGVAGWSSIYDERGRLLQRQLSPVRMLEPTTQDQLRRLWRDQRLPMD